MIREENTSDDDDDDSLSVKSYDPEEDARVDEIVEGAEEAEKEVHTAYSVEQVVIAFAISLFRCRLNLKNLKAATWEVESVVVVKRVCRKRKRYDFVI